MPAQATVLLVVCAVIGAALAACSSGGSSSSKSAKRSRLTIATPADGTIVSGPSVAVSARATGGPSSVRAWVGDKPLGVLPKKGGLWTANVQTSSFVPGANTLVVKALGSKGVVAKAISRVYVLGTPGDLGLAVADTRNGADAETVKIDLGRSVMQLSVTVNGHAIRNHLSPSAGSRSVTLGGGDGVVAGSNTAQVTAVMSDGLYQQANLTFDVPQGAAVAAAGSDVTTRTGIPVRLHATTSRPTTTGGNVSYRWDVVQSPPGSHPKLTNADSPNPFFDPDRPGNYVVRVHVTQPGRATTADDVTVASQDGHIGPMGAHLQTQVASINGVALDGDVVVWNNNGTNVPATMPINQTGAVLALLDRQTLDVLDVVVVNPGGMQTLLSAVTNETSSHPNGVLAVLSSPSGIGGSSQSPNASWEALLQTLGVDDAKTPNAWDKNVQFGNPFSFVSVIGETDKPQVWRSNYSPAPAPGATALAAKAGQLPASLSGYLQRTNGGTAPYVFVPDTYIPIDTSASTTGTTNTMNLGACDLHAPPHSSCVPVTSPAITTCQSSQPTGGFHVVVFRSATLEVTDNAAFATNSGCGAGSDGSAVAAMAALLARYPNSNGTSDHLLAIQSIGMPRPRSGALDSQWIQLATAIGTIGGTPSVLADLSLNSGYSLVGSDALSLPGTDRPYAMGTSGDAPSRNPTARLGAVLARNHRDDLAPSTRSTGGPIGNGFNAVAYAPPTAWPVPCAPDTCVLGSSPAGQQAALDYIRDVTAPNYDWGTEFKIGERDGYCYDPAHPSFRDAYCDANIQQGDWTNFSTFLCEPRTSGGCKPATPPKRHGGYAFTTTDWNAVVTQLSKETAAVASVVAMVGDLKGVALFVASGVSQSFDLLNFQDHILNELKLSEQENSKLSSPGLWLDLGSDLLGVVWAVTGFSKEASKVGAIVGALSEVVAGAATLTDTFGTSGGGAGLTGRVDSVAQDIVADMQNRYAQLSTQVPWTGEMVLTDWGKLEAAANGPLGGGDSGDWNNFTAAMETSSLAWMEPMVLSAAYQPDALRHWTWTRRVCDVDFYPPCSQLEKEHAPYSGDGNTFACQYGAFSTDNYFPWNVHPEAQYLSISGTGAPARYVLSAVPPASHDATIPGNPSDFPLPVHKSVPAVPPANVLTPMLTKSSSVGDTTNLGLPKQDFYEHTMTLSAGNDVTCFQARPVYGPGMAAVTFSQGNDNIFYLTEQSPRTLTNIYSQDGRWNGPGPMPGSPDNTSGLAAVPGNVFYVQHGQLNNDWYTPQGWQGPGGLPGKPEDGAGLAAAVPTPGNGYAFFVQDGHLMYDSYVNGKGWVGPTQLPGEPDKGTALAAVSERPGDMHLFFRHAGQVNNVWFSAGQWQGPAGLPGAPDKDTPFAAVSDSPGSIHLFFVQGGKLNNDWYSPATGWQGPGPLVASPDAGSGIAAVSRGPGRFEAISVVDRALVVDHYENGFTEAPLLYPR